MRRPALSEAVEFASRFSLSFQHREGCCSSLFKRGRFCIQDRNLQSPRSPLTALQPWPEVMSAADCNSNILLEDGCPLLRWHQLEMNVVASPLTNEGITMGSLDILNPFGFRAEHRDEITKSQQALIKCYIRYIPNSSWMLPRSNNHWKAAGCAALRSATR